MTPPAPQKVVAWRYVPGGKLHPLARLGLASCSEPPPCERCGLTATATVLGYVCVLNPGDWLVVVDDRIALVMPDPMFRLVAGAAVVGPDGVLVEPAAPPADDDLDAVLEAAP